MKWCGAGAVLAVACVLVGPLLARQPEAAGWGADAEAEFFAALNDRSERRDAAVELLWRAVRDNPQDGRSNLWLGMAHLWMAAEAGPDAGRPYGNVIIAEHFLSRAERLLPGDRRIPSWLCSARISIAELEGDARRAAEARDRLRGAFEADPCFHAVAVGILAFEHPRGSAEFREGLEAMRAAAECGAGNPSVENRPRWPHNVEGFLLALAQFEIKAGNGRRAEAMLMAAQGRESYGRWPYRAMVEGHFDRLDELLAAYNDGDASNDPVLVIGRGSEVACRVCHTGEPHR